MVVFALTIVGLLVFRAVQVAKSTGTSPEHVNAIAVQPFAGMSEAWNQELIRTLAQVPAGSQETMLQGSVQKDGDHLRITAQLIRVPDNKVLWSGTYDQTTQTAISIQQSIARAVADTLRGQPAKR